MSRWLGNKDVLEEVYFLPYADLLLKTLALEILVLVMDGSIVGRGCCALMMHVIYKGCATCPLCRRGSLWIIVAIIQESVIPRIVRHLKLASVPPPIVPARIRQEIFAFDDAHASVSP